MGSGSALRTAAKAAVLGGYRSAAGVRRALLPLAAPRSDDASISSPPCSPAAAAAEEWVLDAEMEEGLELAGAPPQLVLGPVPSPDEAKAATLDLRDAFEMVNPSPRHPEGRNKVVQSTASLDLTALQISEHTNNSSENSLVAPEGPGHVVQVFTLLQRSPEAQDVVASLVSDNNVWEAVMKNKELMQFYKTYETKITEDPNVAEGGATAIEIPQTDNESSPSVEEAFKDYLQKVKVLVTEMISNLLSTMQDLVVLSNESWGETKLKTRTLRSSNSCADGPPSFVLLAIASILVVLLKRA